MSVDLNKGATVELVKTLSDDMRTRVDGTKAASAGEAVREKADANGTYDTLTTGMATQLTTSEIVEDSEPYLFRKTNGVGTKMYDQIVGGTIAWNQIARNGNFANKATWNAYKANYSASNNEATITNSDTNGSIFQNIGVITEHKYIYIVHVKTGTASSVRATFAGIIIGETTSTSYEVLSKVISISETASRMFEISVRGTAGQTGFAKNAMFIDLTQMFGTAVADYIYGLEQATAGAGVAFFRSLFPQPYYEYNAGELLSVEGLQSHKTVEFNLFDEDTVLSGYGAVKQSDGSWYIETASSFLYVLAWKNDIGYQGQVCVTYEYKYNSPTSAGVRFTVYYTDGSVFQQYVSPTTSYAQATFVTNGSKIVDRIAFTYGSSSVSTWLKNICINLSDPIKNGTYEPYVGHSYALDSSLTLRGVPKLVSNKLQYDGDIYKADGTVTRRYGIVDLGTLAWVYRNDNVTYFYTDVTSLGIKYEGEFTANKYPMLCSKYNTVTRGNIVNDPKKIGICTDGATSLLQVTQLQVYDPAYTDAATFKTAMSGVYLVYELATPTTETADPYTELQTLDEGGTEEYVTTGIVPVGHNTKYLVDQVKKLDGLPSDFSTLIAPTESAMVATRNYTTGDMLIVNNVLYKVTANIANGGTITPNTNVIATTLAEIIKALG